MAIVDQLDFRAGNTAGQQACVKVGNESTGLGDLDFDAARLTKRHILAHTIGGHDPIDELDTFVSVSGQGLNGKGERWDKNQQT